MKSLISTLLFILSMLSPLAGSAGQAEKQKALKAFNEGVKLYEAGDMKGALEKFRFADAMNPSWKLKYNIGQCEASLKQYGTAIEAFEQYLAEGGDEVPTGRRDEVLAELDRLRKMVGTITILGDPGIDIYVDVVKRGNTSVRAAIKVTAGVEHEITFVKEGKKLGTVKVIVSGGEVVSIPTDTKTPPQVTVTQPTGTTPHTTSAASPDANAQSALQYANMRELKLASRNGTISREQYKQHQKKIRERRAAEYEQLKQDLKAGKITKDDYEKRIKEVKKKYEGE